MSLACLVAFRRRLYLLPIVTAIWIILTFFISYAISVGYGHTEADFPYISHTAIEAPERCVFGQLINIGAVMLVMNVLVRYMFLKEIFNQKKMNDVMRWQKCNIAGVVIGALSALGMSIVANFQTKVSRGPHYVGATLAFGCGTAYCILQTRITWKLRREKIGNVVVAITQLINTVMLCCVLVIFVITKTFYKIKEHQGDGTKDDKLRGVYLVSTITEWCSASLIVIYTLTYTWDFRHIVLESPKVNLNFQRLDNGNNNDNSTPSVNNTERNKEQANSTSV